MNEMKFDFKEDVDNTNTDSHNNISETIPIEELKQISHVRIVKFIVQLCTLFGFIGLSMFFNKWWIVFFALLFM